jgi:hypothetical protein
MSSAPRTAQAVMGENRTFNSGFHHKKYILHVLI